MPVKEAELGDRSPCKSLSRKEAGAEGVTPALHCLFRADTQNMDNSGEANRAPRLLLGAQQKRKETSTGFEVYPDLVSNQFCLLTSHMTLKTLLSHVHHLYAITPTLQD